MRILFITQELDQDSDVLGVTLSWIRALAARVEQVHVLALGVGNVSVPPNVSVSSMGKERGAGRLGRLRRFYRTAGALALARRIDVIYVHMVPLYAILAAAVARPLGIPTVLWYTSGGVSARLRLAHRLVHGAVTASPESFRLRSSKVAVTGHGVDTDLFAPAAAPSLHGAEIPTQAPSPRSGGAAGDGDAPRIILAVGRISRVKDHATLIRAAALLRQRRPDLPARVRIVGAPFYADDHRYLAELQELTRALRAGGVVEFAGSRPNRAMPAEYRACDVAVSTSRTGSIDKVVLEAMACARPVLTCNDAFSPVLGPLAGELMFPPGDADALAGRLASILSLPAHAAGRLGHTLREIVVQEHSLSRWADRTVAVLEAICETRSSRFKVQSSRARGHQA